MFVRDLTNDRNAPAIYLAGWGQAQAPLVYSNADLARTFHVSDTVVEDVERKIGTLSRHSATDLAARQQIVPSSVLGQTAAQNALAQANCDVTEVGAVIGCQTILDHMCPSLAARVLKLLGATEPTLTFDLYGGCGCTAMALFQAAELLRAGVVDTVLVVAAEVLTRQLWMLRFPFELFLFGDGAGAFVLSTRRQGPLLLERYTATTVPDLGGVREEVVTVPVLGGGALPALLEIDEHFDPRMPDIGCGPQFRARHHARLAAQWGATYLCQAIRAVTEEINSQTYVVPHQPSRAVLDAVSRELGLLPSQAAFINATHGNLSTASVPVAFCERFAEGPAQFRRTVLAPVGTGLMVGAACFRRVPTGL